MNKADLVERISEVTRIPKVQIDEVITATCKVIAETVASGREVKLVGFGTFDVLQRQERAGRNPQTGLQMTIPAAKVPRFRPGKEFKEIMQDL